MYRVLSVLSITAVLGTPMDVTLAGLATCPARVGARAER
jgi:hypothetical protein